MGNLQNGDTSVTFAECRLCARNFINIILIFTHTTESRHYSYFSDKEIEFNNYSRSIILVKGRQLVNGTTGEEAGQNKIHFVLNRLFFDKRAKVA